MSSVTDAQLKAVIKKLDRHTALAHLLKLRGTSEYSRFKRLWEEVRGTELTTGNRIVKVSAPTTSRAPRIPQTTNLLAAPTSVASPELVDMANTARLKAVILTVLLIATLLIGTLVMMFYKNNPVAAKILGPFGYNLEDIATAIPEVFAPPACENVATKLTLTNAGAVVLPSTRDMDGTYGMFIELDNFDAWKAWFNTPGLTQTRIEQLAQNLAGIMEPIRIDALNAYDFKDAYYKGIVYALVNDKACVQIPDPNKWIEAYLATNAADTFISDTTGSTAYATPQGLTIPAGSILNPTPTQPPVVPQMTPTPIVVLKFSTKFSSGLEGVKNKCSIKYTDPTEALACYNLMARDLQVDVATGVNNTLTLLQNIDSMPNALCQTNIGVVQWEDITSGQGAVWGYVNQYETMGDPAALSLVGHLPDNSLVCAMTTNSTNKFGELKWLTTPKDPEFPEYGSPQGYGVISLVNPGGYVITTNNVFLSPIR